jgi:hypothetical protein
MSIPVYVDAHFGYKANERPRYFTVDEDVYEIATVLDQWYEPSATYFKVQSTEGKTYLLRYDEHADEWTLQSGFDGDDLLGRPSIKMITVGSEAIAGPLPNLRYLLTYSWQLFRPFLSLSSGCEIKRVKSSRHAGPR